VHARGVPCLEGRPNGVLTGGGALKPRQRRADAEQVNFAGLAPLRPRTADIDWDAAIASVLEEPARVRPAFQPIFDLRQGVVAGFEMLARFDAPLQASPLEWVEAARARGLDARLEAVLLGTGLRARELLPAGCFLAVNLGPDALLSPEVGAVLDGRSLEGVVVEMTESGPVTDYERLSRALDRLRAAGADVAVDDTGSGYASLQHVLRLRPSFVKLDRELVAGIDRDPAKLALVEAMESLATRLDACVVAEGVERVQEREVLAALGVPLAQGFALARPGRELQAGLRLPAAPARGDGVMAIVHRDTTVIAPANVPQLVANPGAMGGSVSVAVTDDDGRPVGLLVRGSDGRWLHKRDVLAVQPEDEPAAVARRAMARDPLSRFDPVACCDETGRFMGLVAVDALVGALADRAAA
jgi:EAL domain-containing protein (putative c-di-GMP-specific phosphodiesterase class I)